MFLGIDPDLHHTGIAVCDAQGTVMGVECCMIPGKLKGEDAVIAMTRAISGSIANMVDCLEAEAFESVAVEGQHISFRTPNPTDILHLAHITGAAIGVVNEMIAARLYIPAPKDWKGQVPKIVHQRKLLEELGWPHQSYGDQKSGYTIPTNPPVGKMLKQTHWKHVVDAIGLAR